MLQTSLLLMKSLNKTEIPISLICSVFPKAIFLTFILLNNNKIRHNDTLTDTKFSPKR